LDELVLNPKGILILGEMENPCDIAASIRLATLLGWPVVADILSGVRIGGASVPSGNFKLINHFDQMLLSRNHWKHMKPCSILHLGGRLTSKRLSEFLAWSVLDENTGAPAKYMVVRQARSRYDPFHIVKYRLECSIECLVEAAEKIISETGSPVDSLLGDTYANQFVELDSVVQNVVAQVTSEHNCMTEVHIAKVVSECLPLGHGLFIGNSMPIRDLDMFGGPRKALQSKEPLGAPVAANRGASGIDGVLSTAAGFADGLGRKCTLVVGDISFLHDVNGLNLLRTGTLSPPLTVVLVNNNGGGIFNFLPISGDVPDEQFRPLWTTPQHVDIAGMPCQTCKLKL
jgi:2-succinyl-5-enolpyruvyl-6-hydroxy-3-cyclohexene-1-carboxylate synthase